MYREALTDLDAWSQSPARRPLLIRGARQVGKTHLVDAFAARAFSSYVKINFERDVRFKDCFQSLGAKQVVQSIELLSGQKIIPGETLLFLDEIQECPNAIMALRYFLEEMPELHVIGAGSLLEFALADTKFSMPVGRVSFLYLYPMSFSEFLLALDEENLVDYLRGININDAILDPVHDKLMGYVQLYSAIGGMPYVVKQYVDHKDLLLCREAQAALLASYRADFAKYATRVQQGYCERVFNKSIGMIAKNFRYKDIDPDLDYRGLKQAIKLLSQANILYPIYRTQAAGLPLNATQIDKNYKILFLDIGLVQAAGNVPLEIIVTKDVRQISQGALTEQYVGQHLLTMQPRYAAGELFYWQRDTRNSQAEVDYIYQVGELLVPLEVKSGSTGRLKSLHIYLDEKRAPLGIKLSADKYATTGEVWSIPLYLLEQLPRLIESSRVLPC